MFVGTFIVTKKLQLDTTMKISIRKPEVYDGLIASNYQHEYDHIEDFIYW
jgi:hypothetical protein